MGVYKKDYVLVGIDIINQINDMSGENFVYLETLVEESNEIEMIYDGMSGNYCIIGKVLREIEEGEETDKIFNINHIELENMMRDVKEEIESRLFPMVIVDPLNVNLKVFSYYY